MKLCTFYARNEKHLGICTEKGIIDTSDAGLTLSLEQVIDGVGIKELEALENRTDLPTVEAPVYAPILERPGKLLCVGLNYLAHALGTKADLPKQPLLFCKLDTAYACAGEEISLPAWEDSYDYEAELVIIIGREAWNVSPEEAKECIFGYTCGNDLSCRDAQMATSQWLIGKSMPGFGPCGPFVVTADSFDPTAPNIIRSYVNGNLCQDGTTDDMIFSCTEIIHHASKYIRLCPGDLIFTGTPGGVMLEHDEKHWLKAGDKVDVEIENIGVLTNYMV